MTILKKLVMTPTSKVYIVFEYGGEYEDRWEQVIGVCSSYKLAEELKNKYLASKEVKTNISEEEYGKMLDYLYDYEDEHGTICESEAEGVKKLFPDRNPEDIDAIDKVYFSYNDFGGVNINEVDFYN